MLLIIVNNRFHIKYINKIQGSVSVLNFNSYLLLHSIKRKLALHASFLHFDNQAILGAYL